MSKRLSVFLIDLPIFPKGVISLSFPVISGCIGHDYKIEFVDLNLSDLTLEQIDCIRKDKCFFVGVKVSTQNYKLAIALNQQLKLINAKLKIIWGGEFPSLLPQEAIKYTDSIVCGAFESISEELMKDLKNDKLKPLYNGKSNSNYIQLPTPDYSIIKSGALYSQVMGFPYETSRGCDKKCTFCMVHTMQPHSHFKTLSQLQDELILLKGKYVNVIDYNIGSNLQHLHNVIIAFTNSQTIGWMGEMCLEALDNEDLLRALAKSRCRVIYCGLESIDFDSLVSINKAKTNNVENYSRIIKMAQKYGIQIAAGIIIGLEGASKLTIDSTFKFYQELGIMYAKLTFLTYNPGTKVHESMKRVGKYVQSDLEYFDGNHFTFVPYGVNQTELVTSLSENIKQFYSLKAIKQRALNAGTDALGFEEFVKFNIAYREVYFNWLKSNIFGDRKGFEKLLLSKYKKSKALILNDIAITQIRNDRYREIL